MADAEKSGTAASTAKDPSSSVTRKPTENEISPLQRLPADYTGATLRFSHSLGFRRLSARTADHVDNESIAYLVGKHVAIFNYESKTHKFMLKSAKTASIVSFCVSSNRRYIALSERLIDEGGVQVSLYNFGTGARVRTLNIGNLSRQPVVAMDFSPDNKYLVTATEPPDGLILMWQLDKARLAGRTEVNFSFTQISISPWCHWKLCTTGGDIFRIWHFFPTDKTMKQVDPLPRKKDYRFSCHAWFDADKLVVGTEEGDILVMVGENDRNVELKKTLTAVHDGLAIWSIVAIGRGCICGGDGGMFTLFERTFDDYFQPYKRFCTADKQRIVDITISPNEENVICCLDNNKMQFFSLANVDIMRSEDTSNFKPLSIGFHNHTPTAIDVCVQKVIVVTAGLDRTVRIWNYVKKKIEVVKQFDDDCLSLACHPSGLRLVIGFKYKLCMFNLLVNDLHLCSEFPVKNCREVRFSNGGQFFAAVIVNRILVFSSFNFECLGSLQGHSSMVRSICWTKNDTGLVSAGFEGAIYEWKLDGMRREETEDNIGWKSTAYSAILLDDATGLIAATGCNKVAEQKVPEGDYAIRQIWHGEEKNCLKPGVISQRHQNKTHTMELAICSVAQTLFVGMPNGQLHLYKWPLPPNAAPYQKYDVHQGEILFLALSPDEKFLYTIGDDMSLFMFDVDVVVDGRPLVSRKSFNYQVFDDVSYVLQKELDERAEVIDSLKTQLEELKRQKEKQVSDLKTQYSSEQAQRVDDCNLRVREMRTQLSEASTDKDIAKQQVVETKKQLEAIHMKSAEELESLYHKRTEDQIVKYQRLKEERDDLIVRYENKIYRLQKQRDEQISQVVDQHTRLVSKLTREADQLRGEKDASVKDSEALFEDMTTEYESQLETIHVDAKEKLKKDVEDRENAKNQTTIFKKKFDGLKHEIKELKAEKDKNQKKLQEREKRIEDHERAIQALKLEITVRNDTISTSEKKILELKKQTAELEKLRYVLTFKFNELRKEVAPKEEQIQVMSERMKEMEDELEAVDVDRRTLKQTLGGKEEKLGAILHSLKQNRQLIDDKRRLVSLMLRELGELVAKNDAKSTVYKLKSIIMDYNAKYQKEDVASERDPTQEFERQRDYMETQQLGMKKQSSRKEQHLRHDNLRKTGENALLIKEINDLRRETKLLSSRLSVTEIQIREARALVQQQQRQANLSGTGGGAGGGGGDSIYGTDSPLDDSAISPTGEKMPDKASQKQKRKKIPSLEAIAQMDPKKISEIVATVERNNVEMSKQQEEIRRLREVVQQLLQRAEQEQEAVQLMSEYQQRIHPGSGPAAAAPMAHTPNPAKFDSNAPMAQTLPAGSSSSTLTASTQGALPVRASSATASTASDKAGAAAGGKPKALFPDL